MSNQTILQIVANNLIGKNILLYTWVYIRDFGMSKVGDVDISKIKYNVHTDLEFTGEAQFRIVEVEVDDDGIYILNLQEIGTNKLYTIVFGVDDELRFA